MFDLPFYLMIFAAALLELRRPRAGWPVLALLVLAGLLRPEAWLLGGVVLALARPRAAPRGRIDAAAARRRRPRPVDAGRHDRHRRAALLAHLDPRGLRRVRPQPRDRRRAAPPPALLGRQRHHRHGRVSAAWASILAVWILRRKRGAAARARRPRTLHVPDHQRRRALRDPALHDDPVAAALALRRGRARGLDAGRARDDRAQGGRRRRRPVRAGHRGPRAVLRLGLLDARPPGELRRVPARAARRADDQSQVAAALQACRPITVPTHAPIPILRYETGLPKEAIEASIQQDAPPTEGLQLDLPRLQLRAEHGPLRRRAAAGDGRAPLVDAARRPGSSGSAVPAAGRRGRGAASSRLRSVDF